MTDDSTAIVLILGIMRRSGTNYLYDLLRLHPDCAVRDMIHGPGQEGRLSEDFLVSQLHLLNDYVQAVQAEWNPHWGNVEAESAELRFCLGQGLVSFLRRGIPRGKRLVTKTPSVADLKDVFDFLPEARLVILVRDGRAVVESGVKGFLWDFETAAGSWATGARQILDLLKDRAGDRDHVVIVRYEDIWRDVEAELRKLFAFLSLPADIYDFERARALPVRGSSFYRGTSERPAFTLHGVHWAPVAKTDEFDPLRRFTEWSSEDHTRFNRIAGEYLKRFGYENIE